jgi:hypothetical protein
MVREIAPEEFLEFGQMLVSGLQEFPFALQCSEVDRVRSMVIGWLGPEPGSR